MLEDTLIVCFRTISIIKLRPVVTNLKNKRKQEIKASVDIEMGDLTVPSLVIILYIDKAVNGAIKANAGQVSTDVFDWLSNTTDKPSVSILFEGNRV